MVFLKYLTIVLALFAVAQGLPSKLPNNKAENPLFEEIRALIERLDKSASELNQRRNDIMTGLKEFSDSALEMKTDWNKVAGNEFSEIHVLMYHSNWTSGVDITSCMNAVIDGVDPILDEAYDQVIGSVKRYQNTYLNTWSYVAEEVRLIHGVLDSYLLEAWECENDECLKNILLGVQIFEPLIDDKLPRVIDGAVKAMKPEGEEVIAECYQQIDKFLLVLSQSREDFLECCRELMG